MDIEQTIGYVYSLPDESPSQQTLARATPQQQSTAADAPSPAAAVTQPALRRNSHAALPPSPMHPSRNQYNTSTTPRLLKTSELQLTLAVPRPSSDTSPSPLSKFNQPVQRSPPCRLQTQPMFLPPLKPISSRSQRLCSNLFSSSSRRSVSLPCPPVRWK